MTGEGRLISIALICSMLIAFSPIPAQEVARYEPTEATIAQGNSTIEVFPFSQATPYVYRSINKLDSDGVMMTNYSGVYEYSPLTIARYVVEIYEYWLITNDTSLLNESRAQIGWLKNNSIDFTNHSVWVYNYSNPFTGGDDPWWSALANSFIIGAFLNSYAVDGNVSDLDYAWRALMAFKEPMESHGVLSFWNDTIWYEEAAFDSGSVLSKPSRILNGHIHALAGAWCIYQFNGSTAAKEIFDLGVAAVKRHFAEFDTGMWQRYSMTNFRVNAGYIQIHKSVFNWLKDASGDPEIFAMYNRTAWMAELVTTGYIPVNVTTNSLINMTGYGLDNLFDHMVYNNYWHATTPANVEIDFGEVKEVTFIGYYSPYIHSAPRNWTIYYSVDQSGWISLASQVNSLEFDKCVVLKNPINARYFKFEFNTTPMSMYTRDLNVDEIIISSPSQESLGQALIAIEQHRFNHTYGRILGNAPDGTKIQIDNGSWSDIAKSYSLWLSDGVHDIRFQFNGSYYNDTVLVEYALTEYIVPVFYFPPPEDDGGSVLLIGLSIAASMIVIILLIVVRNRRRKNASGKKRRIEKDKIEPGMLEYLESIKSKSIQDSEMQIEGETDPQPPK